MGILDGKVVAMTGAGGGIGRACAAFAAAQGARVVVNDLGVNPETATGSDNRWAQQAVDEIKSAGGDAIANFSDVGTMEGGAAVIQAAIDTWGRIDGLVNLAAIQREHTIFGLTEQDWDNVVRVNLKGHFTTIKAVAPVMRAQQGGRIVNFTSTAGIRGRVGAGPYGVTKAGIYGMTRVWSRELGRYGVTVNSISPAGGGAAEGGSRLGSIFQQTRAKVLAELEVEGVEQVDAILEKNRARNAGTTNFGPDKIAPLVAYLLGDEAADINGQTFHVGGGNIGLVGDMFPVFRNVSLPGELTVERVRAVVPGLMTGIANPTPRTGRLLPADYMGEPLNL